MMLTDYSLPDLKVQMGKANQRFFVWQPDRKYLILGRSNNSTQALYEEKVEEDKVLVMQRPSGGETVLLSPNMLVLAVHVPIVKGLQSREYFIKCNQVIIDSLRDYGVQDLGTKGISDISIGEKKILGSAIYRGQESVFYHAVLNVKEDIALISKYIKHPTREPDYRKGRSHLDFVTSLWEQNYPIEISELVESMHNRQVILS